MLNLLTNKRVIKTVSLTNSEVIFLSHSSLGIVPVRTLAGDQVPTSPIVDKIFSAYHEVVRRETAP